MSQIDMTYMTLMECQGRFWLLLKNMSRGTRADEPGSRFANPSSRAFAGRTSPAFVLAVGFAFAGPCKSLQAEPGKGQTGEDRAEPGPQPPWANERGCRANERVARLRVHRKIRRVRDLDVPLVESWIHNIERRHLIMAHHGTSPIYREVGLPLRHTQQSFLVPGCSC